VARARLERAITKLDRLLRDGEAAEKKYQRYFEENPLTFQVLGYTTAYPKPRLPLPDGDFLEPDFLAQRPDGLFEIFELKTPQEELIVSKAHRDKLRAKLDEYISQVDTYSEYFDDAANRDRVRSELGFDVQKRPDMTIVAGRDDIADKKILHLLLRRRTNALRVVTYDDILSWLLLHHAALFADGDSLSGVSWHAIVTIHPVEAARRQYIFDAGDSLSKNRWSVFVDARGRLTLEILDADGHLHSVSIVPGTQEFKYGFQHYICCEFGSSDESSFIQILVDNRLAERRESGSPLRIPAGMDFSRKIIGADLEGKNNGTFDMAGLAVYKNVLTFQQRHALAEAIFEEFFSPPDRERAASLTGRRGPILPNTGQYLVIGELGKLD
jgi:hypothetical protein